LYSLIIIDDEKNFIQDICTCIDFNKININLIATAYDGEEGYSKISALMPDIILCDIDMPIMNGFEMLEKVSGIPDYKPQIIMLTGHNDFNHAKKAITLHAVEYIVKPCLPDEIVSVLNMAKNLCDEANHKNSMLFSYAELQTMKFINDIIHNNQFLKIDLLQKQLDLGISLKANCYTLLRIQFIPKTDDVITEKIHSTKAKISNLLINSFNNGFYTNYNTDHLYFLILDMPDSSITTEICKNILEDCVANEFNIYISVSDYCNSVSELPSLLEQVKYCNKFSFCFDENMVLIYSVINEYIRTSFNSREFKLCENNLKNIAEIGFLNSKLYLSAIENFTQNIKYYDPEYFKNIIYRTIVPMFSNLRNFNSESDFDKNSGLWLDILKTRTISELMELCLSIFSKFDGTDTSSVEYRHNAISNYIKNYVYDNYMNSFSVSDIAKSIYVSERRIREYFLNVNGISISDFITNYRMQKALELIKSSKYKIQEIMEMVGYDTEHGFRNAFTKFYGNPPSHYIKKK